MGEARVVPLYPRSHAGAGPTGAGPTDGGHAGGSAGEHGSPVGEPAPSSAVATVAEVVAFLRRRLLDEHTVDPFGFDPELAEHAWYPVLRPFYEKWFRVDAFGLDNVPDEGGALVVANHSGTLPWDALMTSVAVHDHHPARRHLRMLGADLVFRWPVVREIASRAGHALACPPNAERLLAGGELAAVWPEGFKGIGKPFHERYKLQRFGRGGFAAAALRTGAPIVPCAITGAEETYPKIGDIRPLARLLGLPYFPVTPLFPLLGPLGAVPLPTKWCIEFGDPVRTDTYPDGAADDPVHVFDLTDRVRERVQQALYRMLAQRTNVFAG